MSQENHAPWYKQTWLWFVLAPLIAVMIYAPVFIYLAVTTSDGIVKEDYYKVARGLNIDHSREQHAAEMGINGELMMDSLTGDIQLRLNSATQLPEELQLSLVHPTHQKYDQVLRLRSLDGQGIYSGSLQDKLESKRYLILEPMDQSWQLRLETTPPYDHVTYTLGRNG
ncbi:MAG: hypothetical protein CMI01_07990 [Oceanospirillaceae bacterium]|nr:hypothetical protein [Oceanospirillaceae bacterium]